MSTSSSSPPDHAALIAAVQAALFKTNYIVSKRHRVGAELRGFREIAQDQAWINASFQTELTRFNAGANAVRAAGLLKKGAGWSFVYPIPREVSARKGGRMRPNPSAKSRGHLWWLLTLETGQQVWLHGVLSQILIDAVRILSRAGGNGIDTADRREAHGAGRLCGWTARTSEMRQLGLPVSTTPTSDWSRKVLRLHCPVRFSPPRDGVAVLHLGDLLGMPELVRSQQEMGDRFNAQRVHAIEIAARQVQSFLRVWTELPAALGSGASA